MQFQPAADHRHAQEHEDALDERNGARVLQHDVDLVEDDGHDQDVEDVHRADCRDDTVEL